MDPELTQELEEQIRQLNQTLAQLSGVMSDQSKVVSTTTSSVQQNNTVVKNNNQSTKQNSQAQDKLAEASKSASDAMDKASQNFSSALSNGTQALNSFQSALFSSQEGMAKYGRAAESAGAAAFDVGKNFGILGFAVGGLLSIFGKVVGEVFKLNDNIINMRDSFTKAAGILPTTTTELGNLAKQARFSLDDMQKLSKATNDLGSNLLGLGGYAGQGAIKFMKMAAVSDDVRRQYGRLGVSQEQLLELQAKYVEMQGVSGGAFRNQGKTADQLQRESLAYADNLIKMSSLTGKAADDLQRERDQAMMEYEEQLQIAAENAKIAELRKNRRFEEANAIQLEQENRGKLIQQYTSLYGAEQGQLAGRLMRQGGYDEKTGSLAVRDPNMLEFTQNLKKSKDAMGDIMKQADKTDKSYDEASVRYGKALQFVGEEGGNTVGITKEAITQRNLRAKPPSEALKEVTKDIDTKKQAGKDPLADNIEGMRSFEREMKAKLQTFLEKVDPMRNGFDMLKKLAIAAAVALGAVTAIIIGPKIVSGVKAVGSGISSGLGAVGRLFGRGKGAAGAASAAGAAGSLGKIESVAQSPGASKTGGFLMGLTNGLEAAGKAGMKVVTGAGYLGGAIGIIGAAVAAATWLMGAALPNLAEGLKSFEKLNGPNLKAVGLGMAGLGAGVLAMGAGGVADAIGNVINWFVGGEDPIEETTKQIAKFQEIDLNTAKVENNSKAVIAFAEAMAAVAGLGALGSMAGVSKSVADSISNYFGGKPPTEELVAFSQLKINKDKVKNNATAFVLFSEAMAAYKGFGAPTAAIGTAIATAAAKFFGVKPPLEEFVEFSRLQIDGKKTPVNAKAFVDFANAMATYKGGPGLIDTISSLLGKGFGTIFGEDGPVEAFRKFSKEDFGPMASTNAENFKKYAQTVSALGGVSSSPGAPGAAPTGSSSFSSAVQSGLSTGASIGSGIVGAIGGAASAVGSAITGAAEAGWEKVTAGWDALKIKSVLNFTSQSGSYENFQALNPGMKAAVLAAATEYKKVTGNKLQVNSARRSLADQQRLWDTSVRAGTPGRQPNGRLVAKPNPNAPHIKGNAIDLQQGISDTARTNQILAKYKLVNKYGKRDLPHYDLQAREGGVFSGSDAGYQIEMHGSEMVAPVNLDSVLMKLAKTPANNVNTKKLTTEKSTAGQVTDKVGEVADQATLNLQLYGMIARKIERIVSVIENSHDTHDKMLRHSKA